MVDVRQHVGLKIKAARLRLKLTQRRLAEAVDKTIETISNIERGHSLTGVDTLELICRTLHMPLADLFEGFEKARPHCRRRVELEQQVGALLQSLPDQDVTLALDLIGTLAKRRNHRNML